MAATGMLDRADVNAAMRDLGRELIHGTDDQLHDYLDRISTVARAAARNHEMFRRWSHRNRLMLEAQRRRLGENHLGLYAGVRQWARIDREPRDDARAKAIWAARTPKPDDDDSDDDSGDGGDRPRPGAPRFVLVPVYDWSDTRPTGDDVDEPDWAEPLGGGDEATLARLVASSPVPVTRRDLTGRVEHGWLGADGITIAAQRPFGGQVWTMCHELAHHYLGHRDDGTPRDRAEQEAELAAYLAALALGVDTDGAATRNAAAYLRHWTDRDGNAVEGTKRRIKLLVRRLDRAQSAVDEILAAYQRTAPTARLADPAATMPGPRRDAAVPA